jgi:two-component system CheB/CheR fusion protein
VKVGGSGTATTAQAGAPADLTPAAPAAHAHVVAVGASAGGLDALERFFAALPVDSGAAYVVIQHLSPDHKSMMDNLLARHTRMPVQVATHGMPLAPDCVFLIPPATQMTLAAGRLQLAPKPEHGLSLPIDVFFRSMAEQVGSRAVAIVLSGTGSDGARGVPRVNEEGGLVLVQAPASAKFDGMPRAAIATGLVDAILPPEQLAQRLVDYLRSEPPLSDLAGDASARRAPLTEQHLSALDQVLAVLQSASGINFREYKPGTVIRRVERRMQVRHCRNFADYLATLQSDPSELVTLRRELLIPVTRFFRDPEAFDVLGSEVIPRLVESHAGNEPIRVWVAACATGEEAYSIAILFAETFERLNRWPPLKIFATDIEQEYLDFGSAGVYPEAIAAEVSPARLERFFTHRAGSYVVRNELRAQMIFARHNLVEDPPFTRMDLVSCRNMLIYLQPRSQDAAVSRLHYALASGGVMFMGPSETLGALQEDFATLSAKHKLYRVVRRGRAVVGGDGPSRSAPARRVATRRAAAGPDASLQQDALTLLLAEHAPPALLVGRDRVLVHVFGGGRRYLQIPAGDVSLDVLNLLPPPLAASAAAMIHVALKDGAERRSHPVEIDTTAGRERVRLRVRPVPSTAGARGDAELGEPGVLLLFEAEPESVLTGAPPATAIDLHAHIETLERELAGTRANLQSTIEELETANEELQATNEELIAANEELQSTNEELQSVNEELITVNAEYQEKVDVLNRVNADLENVARATSIPTLFVDEALCLSRFTPEATQLFKIKPTDVGRSIEDFNNTLDYPEFFAELRRTLNDGAVIQREVADRGGRWYLARIQPYAQSPQSPRRAVVSFIDVTRLKDAQRLQAVLDSLPEHVAVLDAAGQITMVNQAWRQFAQANGDHSLSRTGPGTNYLQVCAGSGPQDDDARRAHQGLSDVLAGRVERFSLRYPCHSATEQRWFLMHAARMPGHNLGAVVSHVNITPFMRPLPGPAAGAASNNDTPA